MEKIVDNFLCGRVGIMPSKPYSEVMRNPKINTPTGEVILFSEGNLMCLDTKSEVITEWWYSPTKEALKLSWNGRDYFYQGVPYSVIHEMLGAESLGKFANSVIKPNYEAREAVK